MRQSPVRALMDRIGSRLLHISCGGWRLKAASRVPGFRRCSSTCFVVGLLKPCCCARCCSTRPMLRSYIAMTNQRNWPVVHGQCTYAFSWWLTAFTQHLMNSEQHQHGCGTAHLHAHCMYACMSVMLTHCSCPPVPWHSLQFVCTMAHLAPFTRCAQSDAPKTEAARKHAWVTPRPE